MACAAGGLGPDRGDQIGRGVSGPPPRPSCRSRARAAESSRSTTADRVSRLARKASNRRRKCDRAAVPQRRVERPLVEVQSHDQLVAGRKLVYVHREAVARLTLGDVPGGGSNAQDSRKSTFGAKAGELLRRVLDQVERGEIEPAIADAVLSVPQRVARSVRTLRASEAKVSLSSISTLRKSCSMTSPQVAASGCDRLAIGVPSTSSRFPVVR